MDLKWKDEYAIGVYIIDEQHKILVDILYDIHSLKLNTTENQTNKGAILTRLQNYSQIHFTTEEEIMRIYGYQDYENHKLMHAQYLSKIEEFRKFYYDDKSFMFQDVCSYIEGWLSNHILREDRKLGPYLNSKGLK